VDFHFSHEIIQIKNHILDSKFDQALKLIEEVEIIHSMNDVIYLQAQNLRAEIYTRQQNFDEALIYLELSEQLNNENNRYISIETIILKMKIYEILGKSDKISILGDKFEELIKDVELPLFKETYMSSISRVKGIININKKNFETAAQYFETSLNQGKYTDNKNDLISTYNLLSIAYSHLTKYDKAVEILNRALGLVNKESLPKMTKYVIMTNLAQLYHKKGNLNESEKTYNEVLDYFNTLNQPGLNSGIYKNLGELFYHYGKINKAINFTNKSIESFRLIDHQAGVIASQILLAKIKYISNEVNSAISILDEIFGYKDQFVNTLLIYEVILFRILIFCRTDNKRPIDNYISFFDKTKDSQITASVKVVVELIDAILSLSKPGIRSKAAALVKLEWIFNQDEVNFEFKNYSIRLLIEILLTDYKENLSNEIFEEIIQYLTLLEQISKRENLYPTLIETMIIRSKFLVIQGKFQESDAILNDAIILADKYKLETPKKQITLEKARLVDEFQRLKSFVDINYEFLDDIEKQEFNNYLDTIRRFRVQLES
jgi:tetratricopeptide (TPR) repeat protein